MRSNIDFTIGLCLHLVVLSAGVDAVENINIPATQQPYYQSVQSETPEQNPLKTAGIAGQKTRQEIQALIEDASKTKPGWWETVPLTYPETLDLRFPSGPNRPWNSQKNIGQYMWSIINENANRFHEGTKFMHYVYSLNRDNPDAAHRAAQQLGHCYHDLLQDWARAAYWLQKASERGVKLANAYWHLGSKEMAEEILRPITSDYTDHGAVIKLWSDMGELETALELANKSKDPRSHGGVFRAAGDALHRHGRFDEAIGYYEKVLDIGSRFLPSFLKKNGKLQLNKNHAKAAIESIRIFEMFDVTKLRDGSYTDISLGYSGEVAVNVRVKNQRIESLIITRHAEKQYYSSLTDIPEQILRKQDIRDIDATTGATVTADAIRIASAKALQQARK
ncbi:MAG: FMN-binding protein [Methylococcaceae bacterium]|nr:FMN-binding protein [Methylococcaceae bacterium]MCI0734426.1 FMN-binding protein [Methylococcaceae bacterium]